MKSSLSLGRAGDLWVSPQGKVCDRQEWSPCSEWFRTGLCVWNSVAMPRTSALGLTHPWVPRSQGYLSQQIEIARPKVGSSWDPGSQSWGPGDDCGMVEVKQWPQAWKIPAMLRPSWAGLHSCLESGSPISNQTVRQHQDTV